MRWLERLWRPARSLDRRLAERLESWRRLRRPDPDESLTGHRLVVVDVETTGLDPHRDRLISIGAVAVREGLVRLDECFECVLRQDSPSAVENILVHRIGGEAQTGGQDPAEALIDFLLFAGKDPLVGFHADFDRVLIERATGSVLGVEPDALWMDLAQLAPALFPTRASRDNTLDDWLRLFAIENPSRHAALSDAVATAQLLLPVLSAARGQRISSCGGLVKLEKGYRWLSGGRQNA